MIETKEENKGTAILSECGKYRYVLTRSLNSVLRWHKPMLFIMLNPSTADASVDDPTIRRCIAFAKRAGATQLTVVNLFALRSPDPESLAKSSDPIGPENDRHIAEQIGKHKGLPIIAAWGAHKFAKDRATQIVGMYNDLFCLGKTKNGEPRHPLYVKGDQEFIKLTE
ncbi:DUF1643 domain-containing protein [Bdellovibrio sp. BCCA]|uniref:DUF1643 domain-containing protein n=1 Tax=Bdellovibrio sp. BCCA TaxID=3136281 RepID=UPI0030F34889